MLLPAALKKPSGKSLLAFLVLLSTLLTLGFALRGESWVEGVLAIGLPLGICTAIGIGLGYWTVPLLRRLKAGQVMQEDGPQAHLSKAGTPTLGGIFFVPPAAMVAIVWSRFDPAVTAASALTLAYLGIGWLDDWQILRQQSNRGISPRMKLSLQIAAAVLFCLWALGSQPASITDLRLPGPLVLSLGAFFWLLAGFVLVAESNATNLTDGVDGLAAGTAALAFLGLAALATPASPGLTVFCACLSGGCLGFVCYNRNPAQVFMGDTGSLAIGGALAAAGILSGHLWGLFVTSGIFFVESLSVIAQVGYYKATKGPDGRGKRLLKMAPLHHHLELSGWSETQIVGVFYAIAAGLAVLAVISSPG